jgi:pentatricopeptide repeat protein
MNEYLMILFTGFQYRQCLEFLDEMTDMGIQKNVIIFGAAMSCMEKCSRADIGFELLKRMRIDGIEPNVHIYNSLISACSRSNLWEKGYELYEEMGRFGIARDVVTYNAVLDAVASQVKLGRKLFEEGVEKGFYAKVSRLGGQWLELDLHFLSLGGGEIALGWWFEVCLVPYLSDIEKLSAVKTISVVTGYGKTRTRGRRHGDDGMRLRVRTMLHYMNIHESEQPNAGRIHIDKDQLTAEVNRNGGKIVFDLASYVHWKETQTTANVIPDVEQKIRARFKPKKDGSGRPPFVRVETESTSEEYLLKNQRKLTLDQAVGGTDYRADIDYAVRDGIRFEVGSRRTSFDKDEEFRSRVISVGQQDRCTDRDIHAVSQVSRSAGRDLEVNQSTYGPRGRAHESHDRRRSGQGNQDNRANSMRSSPRAPGYNDDTNNNSNDNSYNGRYDPQQQSSCGDSQRYSEGASRPRQQEVRHRHQSKEPEAQRSDSYRSSGHTSNHRSERNHHSPQPHYERGRRYTSNDEFERIEHHHGGQQFDDHGGHNSTDGNYHGSGIKDGNRPRDHHSGQQFDDHGGRNSTDGNYHGSGSKDGNRPRDHQGGQQFDDHGGRNSTEGNYHGSGSKDGNRPRDDRPRNDRGGHDVGGSNGDGSRYQRHRQKGDYYGPTPSTDALHHPKAHGGRSNKFDQHHQHQDHSGQTDQRQRPPTDRKRSAEASGAGEGPRSSSGRGYAIEPPVAQHRRFS